MRVGVFGGTFDPVHLGHLILAEQCREQARLDQVWFVPAAHPPNKLGDPVTPFHHRVEMLELAVAVHPGFAIDPLEKERQGPSFTVDTLGELHRRHPGHEFWLMAGSDTLLDLPNWREPARIVELAGLLVVARPGHPLPEPGQVRAALRLPGGADLRLRTAESPLIDVASRDLRRRVAEGRSVRYLVPRAVEAYIHEKHLYRMSDERP
jgi:nicotinate-nucleotide adenylyltransferase